jgi:hypothetical protein
MNRTEFQHLLDAYGAHLSAWPDEERRAAEKLLATDAIARAHWDEAQSLDRLIVRVMSEQTSVDAAAGRVLAKLAHDLPPQRRPLLSWPRALLAVDLSPSRLRIATLAAMACLGLILGLFGPDIGTADPRFALTLTPSDINLAAMFEPEPLTGVTP